MGKNMYIGVDMGTSSDGVAVTDENYTLYRVKGKDFWTSRLFKEANTAAERRTNRVSRRRRQRENARMGILRELFSEEINKVDEGFFARLDESKYHIEDRVVKQKYALFADKGYTDKEYYKEYPTIFHLRNELLHPQKNSYDVRLVYLAIANMFKHRGNFLNETLDIDKITASADDVYSQLIEELDLYCIQMPVNINIGELINIISEKGISRSKRLENASKYLGISKKDKQSYEILKLICGLKGILYNIYGENVIDEENKKFSLSFTDSNYEDEETQAKDILGDEYFELIEIIKELHDIGVLSGIIKGHKFLSEARVELYEEHKKDLDMLQQVLKKYDKNAYDEMFRVMKEGNYSAYVGSVNARGKNKKIRRNVGEGKKGKNGRSQEAFYKYVKTTLKNYPDDDENIKNILFKIENETFMPKQLTASNGIIPNQLHAAEMKAILTNAEKYLPFLLDKDESGLTVSQRILELFKFHIPYYVGPLGAAGKNVWAKRRKGEEKGRIYPWNFEKKIDTQEAAEEFIKRMVRHCSYIKGEHTLPKQSLLYEKFMVLNELNNLKINGTKPDVFVKQDIYENLFKTGKRVTLDKLKSYLYNNSFIDSKEVMITGIDGGFNSSLTSVGKFIGILGEDLFTDSNQAMVEQIIFWGTIYGNDKKFLKNRIEKEYNDRLTPKQIKCILGFKFNGWGKLSKRFLELKGSCECGECSIIQALWQTNHNLMELMSDQYDFKTNLMEVSEKTIKPLSEWTIDNLEDYYMSAPVKRMVWQTIKMLNEICELTGRIPDKIFVEMPREHENGNERKASRKKKLLDLYKAIKSEQKQWAEQMIAEIDKRDEADFRIKKLYLYYIQQGKCMYSGDTIDLDLLLKNNNIYDIDHIYPRHFIKDDSIDNNLVLVKKEINNHKSDKYPLESDIKKDMSGFWKYLCEKKFITKEKYNRLMRTDKFSAEEKAAFVNRQLVETGQGTKVITQILKQAFPDTQVVFVKARMVSDFRHEFGINKVRELNDTHHAKDAYLNIVVGNTYYTKFTNNPINFMKNAEKNPEDVQYKYNMDKIFRYNVIRNGETAWIADNGVTKQHVLKTINRNTVTITRKTEEVHGALSNKVTVWSSKLAKKNPDAYMPVKTTDEKACDVTKYGGITAIANSGYTLVEYNINGKMIRSIEALPVYLGRKNMLTDDKIKEYLHEKIRKEYKNKTVTDLKVCILFIPQKSKVCVDGFNYYLGGVTGNSIYLSNAEPLYLSKEDEEYLRKIIKAVGKGYYEETDKNGQIIITDERNMKFFNTLGSKLNARPYCNNRWNIYKIMENKEEIFAGLSIEKQCYVINQIISWINSKTQNVDLSDIKGGSHSGTMTLNKKISECSQFELIYQSVTGMYEKRTDLLKL